MQIENCIGIRLSSGTAFPKVRPLPTRGIKLYQSESESSTDNILEYYQGPNHLAIEGLETLPFTFMVQRDGSITQWNDIAVQATPVPQEPFVAVLIVGCFTVDGSDHILGTATTSLTLQQRESIQYLKEFVDTAYGASLNVYADSISGLELQQLCKDLNTKS